MKLFRLNNNWLRFRVNKLIRRNHEDLFKSFWHSKISNFQEYTFHRDRWWLILSFVIVVFSIASIVDLSFLNFIKINGSTAKILVDQRTGNIAAITAITLVVVGFLINNLAVKESFAYRLLFKHSYLYPTIYLTLSTVGCFFITSTLRDQLNETSFINTVLAGTYLAIVILILIGFLFKTIIEFTNDRTIKKLLHEELMIEAKRNLKVILIKQYSSELYNQVITEKGAKEYNWAEALDFAKTDIKLKELDESDLDSLKSKEKRIGDINVKRLIKFITKKSKKSGQVFYQKMSLENITTEWDNYLWQKDNPNSENDKTFLKRSLVLTNPKKLKKDKESVRKYFDQKLETFASNSEHRDLENILESYIDLYKLQMKHQK
jgi:hypothetical protein